MATNATSPYEARKLYGPIPQRKMNAGSSTHFSAELDEMVFLEWASPLSRIALAAHAEHDPLRGKQPLEVLGRVLVALAGLNAEAQSGYRTSRSP